jgi:hypothetical protein
MRAQNRYVAPALASAILGLAPASARADVVRPNPYEDEDFTREFSPVEERDFGFAMAHLYARYARSRDADALAGLSDLVVGGISARGIYGRRVGYGFGLGLEIGASVVDPGFAFSFDLFPAGVAVAIGPTGFFGAFFGVSVGGVTARVPYSIMLPAELRLELDVTRRARLGAMLAVSWAPAEEDRRGGSELFPFADETTLALTARFGKTFPRSGSNMGRGYFFRLERREQMGTTLLGLAFGVEIDVAQ